MASLLPGIAIGDSSSATIEPGTTSTTEVTVEVDEPAYDAFQVLLDEEARAAMAAGDYKRAWYFFWRLLEIDPDDTRALREAGRVAQALGKFTYSIEALARVEVLAGSVPDPELHYLRGEALHALGREAEAEAEWAECERELGAAPPIDRRGILWLARIAALRGELDDSLALYDSLLTNDHSSAEYAEVVLFQVEAHTLSQDWASAERLVREFLEIQPDHERGRALLAWVLDARGKNDESLSMHAVAAEEWTDHPRKTLEYARALERAYEYPEALDRYREARALGVEEVNGDISRLRNRLSPELFGGASLRDDPSGTVTGWTAGATLPLGGRRRIAVTTVRESSGASITPMEDTSTSVAAWGLLTGRRGSVIGLGVSARQSERDRGIGASALGWTSPERRYQFQFRGDFNQAWRESSSTIREGGVVDTAAAQVYASPWSRRLLLSLGFQARRLGLDERMIGAPDVHANQLFGAAGVDFTLTSSPNRVARGEILDGELLAPRALATSAVLSYRHYEMASDDPFGSRLVLVERSSVDEVSGVVRRVLDRRGVLATELRGGLGYDWNRSMQLYRGGASLLLSATASSRFSFDYDVASETGTGLIGRRHAGSVVFHLDL